MRLAGENHICACESQRGGGIAVMFHPWKTHDQERHRVIPSSQLRRSLEQLRNALVICQQAEIDDELVFWRNAQRGALRGARFWSEAGRGEEIEVDAIGQGENAMFAVETAREQLRAVDGAGDNGIGQLDDALFQPPPPIVAGCIGLDEAVIHHLGGQTALEIEDQRHAQQPRQHAADERALVQVSMDQVGTPAQGFPQRPRREQHIESDFVPRGADFVIGAPGRGRRAHDIEAGPIAPHVVGGDAHLHSLSQERLRFFQNAHMAAVVQEKGRGRDHQNAFAFVAHGAKRRVSE